MLCKIIRLMFARHFSVRFVKVAWSIYTRGWPQMLRTVIFVQGFLNLHQFAQAVFVNLHNHFVENSKENFKKPLCKFAIPFSTLKF